MNATGSVMHGPADPDPQPWNLGQEGIEQDPVFVRARGGLQLTAEPQSIAPSSPMGFDEC